MSLPPDYFDGIYASDDPWGFTDRWYEQRKRALTLANLPEARYATAYEPGCSIGVLTAELATRCDDLLATDVSHRALELAGARLAGCPHVRLRQAAVPADWPAGRFDLVVLSELLYYFDSADLKHVVTRAVASVAEGGTLLAVHWRHQVADYPQSGDAVQAALHTQAAELVRTVEHLEEDVALSVHVRPRSGERAVSVAARTGLC